MSRLRLLLLVGCVGALVSGGSVLACVAPDPTEPTATPAGSVSALGLLQRAAAVTRSTSWKGVQSILSTRGDMPHYDVLIVTHTPGAGSTVEGVADNGRGVAPDLLDDNLFALLARHYDLRVAGAAKSDGRDTLLVEAGRPGETGASAVAGRFWIDRVTHMVWRRDVMDDDGGVVVSNAFSELRITDTPPRPTTKSIAAVPPTTHLDDRQVQQLIDDGWPIVDHLPSGLELFDARLHPDGVVQLAYSDGLSTLSLFVQHGALPAGTGGVLREVGGGLVHVTSTAPEQLVWSGGGRTWTLVSDAPESTIDEAVLVLPHADPPVAGEGVGDKVWRGLSRVGAWLNPFA
ncbi:MAG: putative sigma regulatory protein MucB/RseB [Frankiales bacterium]|nr:putative sigma regulatory protein MucB/RseB [Frankiales bacterium]